MLVIIGARPKGGTNSLEVRFALKAKTPQKVSFAPERLALKIAPSSIFNSVKRSECACSDIARDYNPRYQQQNSDESHQRENVFPGTDEETKVLVSGRGRPFENGRS